ncbi:MAG: EpsG family protein, partial [Clostridia bacterium]|nr:EpsG family protein [Clostridia bacterium]
MEVYVTLLLFCAVAYFFGELKPAGRFVGSTTLIKNDNKPKLVFCIAMTIIFIFISSFRNFNVGYDTVNYLDYYVFKQKALNANVYEFLFEAIYTICAFLKLPFTIVSMICAIVSLSAFCYFIYKYSPDPIVSLFLFVALGFFGNTLNAVRQYLALAVFLWGVKYVIHGDFAKYLLCCLVAIMFHSSAFFLLPLYFLRYVKPNWKSLLAICVIVALCIFGIKPLTYVISLFTKINYYDRYFNSID